MNSFLAFLPELVVLLGAFVLFALTLGESAGTRARHVALATGLVALLASIGTLGQTAVLFSGAYRVDLFSQLLKLVLTAGFTAVAVINGRLPDVREKVRPEYYLFLTLSISGLLMLVSSLDAITIVIALELSSFPLYLMVAMRREREGQRMQMESAVKYIMFGVAANGIMFFGLSYLFGLTSTTHIPAMVARLAPVMGTPLAIAGLTLTFAGFLYKLAVFPFHFWTPDVYQGASNETTSLIASLPKIGAVAVLVRFVSLATPANHAIATILTCLAIGSMFYGNLIALAQKDLKRLLGFSAIAHAGYALVGFVSLSEAGYGAALYYISGYMLMVLACFLVISRVARDGANVGIDELAGLHRRSPLLALTLLVGLFGLAGIPPFVGFMGKLSLLTAAFAQGHVALVVIAMLNAAIAIYYYLNVVRKAVFGEKVEHADESPIVLDWQTRGLCVALIVCIVALGVVPTPVLEGFGRAVTDTIAPIATTIAGR
ncbi:NADH-quinone oxidoreductase subunit N [Opitutus sp. ER46]|uniref:NADH-quinone oxidoreductase subunit N n=1 Tax=Opitutus sp. ER46 TaxID=2161864 RepID=UPI000D2F82F8|nr:NADH-quinone oxidoreductase subunit N [Opitutus sp. ER46]PTX90678.1 NADH-quinone oxidoreductase subunit N [Opitutus sp. ER46]